MVDKRDVSSGGSASYLQEFIINNIHLGRQIGRGANGRILEAKWEGAVVAVKQIHSIFVNEVSELEFQVFKRSFLRECEQSSRLRHPNIVRFFGIYHPPDAKVPGLVMERLHCSLTNLLEQNPVLPIEIKLSIIHDVSLGLRYLHTRTPIIIHRDLSSNNVLITKGMEGKIGDLGTARLVDPKRQSQMTKVPGTVDFMPPEALAAGDNVKYERELDVFSFGCVMLHTLSQQWPTPSEPVVTDPVNFKMIARSEIERRSSYFNKIDKNKSSVLIPIIKSCLSNIPKSRASIVPVCTHLEELVDKQHSATNRIDLLSSTLQQEIKEKDAEIQDRDAQIQSKNDKIQYQAIQIRNQDGQIQCQAIEIEALKSSLSKLHLQLTSDDHNPVSPNVDLLSRQVNKSSIDFWNNLKPTWKCCAELPTKCWITSVAELDGNVYVTINSTAGYTQNHIPLMYDSNKDQWSALPKLPYTRFSLVAIPDRKQLLAVGGVVFAGFVANTSNKVFLWDEKNEKWSTSYPNMPTPRYDTSSIYHRSTCTVIVAGGRINNHLMTGAVEVLHIREHSLFSKSYWNVVKQLPHIVCEVVPLIINDNLYIAVGFDEEEKSTRNIETAFIPELLKSNNKITNKSQVWKKLPDTAYSSFSINHVQGHLITFTGDYKVKKPGKFNSVWEVVSLIHLYNPSTFSWDCVGDVPCSYLMGRSIRIGENKIFFIGGVTGTHAASLVDDMLPTCLMLTLTPK